MGNHHTTILSMLPPWVGIVIGHVSSDLTISNLASFASTAYCVSFASFGVSTMTVNGSIRARRVR
jgi:hypothetical protein